MNHPSIKQLIFEQNILSHYNHLTKTKITYSISPPRLPSRITVSPILIKYQAPQLNTPPQRLSLILFIRKSTMRRALPLPLP